MLALHQGDCGLIEKVKSTDNIYLAKVTVFKCFKLRHFKRMFTFKFRHHKLNECSYHGNVLSKRRSEEPVEFYVLVGQNFLENKKKNRNQSKLRRNINCMDGCQRETAEKMNCFCFKQII